MSHAGEFRLCSGCGQWAIWSPLHPKGPVYCCQACARGLRCVCAREPDDWVPVADFRRDIQGERHA